MAGTDSEIRREDEWGMDGVFLQGPTPPISFEMAIDSPVWQLSTGNDGRPKFIFTITSHFNHPITLRTYGTILDPRHPYRGGFFYQRFTIKDIDTGLRIGFSGDEPQLCNLPKRRLGTNDERGFTTLQPGQPVTVSYGVPCLSYNDWFDEFDGGSKGQLTFKPRGSVHGGEVYSRCFEPGHRYRIGVQNRIKTWFRDRPPERDEVQVTFWWRYGLKEEVMAPTSEGGRCIGWSEHEIQISGIPDVEMACEK